MSGTSPAAPTASPAPSTTATAVPALTTAAAVTIPVKVYDTSNQALANVIAQAQKDGATTIVGPLLKNEVEQLPGLNPTLNVLALNQPEHIQPNPNICYFALSPEDEAADAAQFIHKQGKQHPLILARAAIWETGWWPLSPSPGNSRQAAWYCSSAPAACMT